MISSKSGEYDYLNHNYRTQSPLNKRLVISSFIPGVDMIGDSNNGNTDGGGNHNGGNGVNYGPSTDQPDQLNKRKGQNLNQ